MITPLPALLEENPIIIAIKDEEDLARCLQNPKPVVFVLYGSVVSIPDIVRRLKEAGKTVFVDVDLLDGLSAREAAVEYLVGATEADGVISTKAALVRRAKALGCTAPSFWITWLCKACAKAAAASGRTSSRFCPA